MNIFALVTHELMHISAPIL